MTQGQGYEFVYNDRLGIHLPVLHLDWIEYSKAEQEAMIEQWERIKSRIPDRVHELEAVINQLQLEASQEDDWDRVCSLYEELYRIASIINDLNIWEKVDQYTSSQDEAEETGLAVEHQNREQA